MAPPAPATHPCFARCAGGAQSRSCPPPSFIPKGKRHRAHRHFSSCTIPLHCKSNGEPLPLCHRTQPKPEPMLVSKRCDQLFPARRCNQATPLSDKMAKQPLQEVMDHAKQGSVPRRSQGHSAEDTVWQQCPLQPLSTPLSLGLQCTVLETGPAGGCVGGYFCNLKQALLPAASQQQLRFDGGGVCIDCQVDSATPQLALATRFMSRRLLKLGSSWFRWGASVGRNSKCKAGHQRRGYVGTVRCSLHS